MGWDAHNLYYADCCWQARQLPANPGPELHTLYSGPADGRVPGAGAGGGYAGTRVHPVSCQPLPQGGAGQHLLTQPGVHYPAARWVIELETKAKRRFAKVSQSRRRPLLGLVSIVQCLIAARLL